MNDELLKDIREGFAGNEKSLPAKWLYDERGSELFEAITKTADYYVTRTEAAIMKEVYEELPALCGEGVAVAEFGSGAGIKSRRLIEALRPSVYVSIDVAEDYLEQSCDSLRGKFPETDIHGVVADFSGKVDLPAAFFGQDSRLGFFPGSTIGNFETGGAQAFLEKSRQSLGEGSRFLVGVDLVKDEDALLAAYDDSEGVTRRFTLNLLRRINRELDADIDIESFDAVALWNPERERMELGLVSLREQAIEIGGERYDLARGEMIHTENSHKYTEGSFGRIADAAGWTVEKLWSDDRNWFGVFLLKA